MNDRIVELTNTYLNYYSINMLDHVMDLNNLENMLFRPPDNIYLQGSLKPLLNLDREHFLVGPDGIPHDMPVNVCDILNKRGFTLIDNHGNVALSRGLLDSNCLVLNQEHLPEISTIKTFVINYVRDNWKHSVFAPEHLHSYEYVVPGYASQVDAVLSKDCYELILNVEELLNNYQDNLLSFEDKGHALVLGVLPDYRIFEWEYYQATTGPEAKELVWERMMTS